MTQCRVPTPVRGRLAFRYALIALSLVIGWGLNGMEPAIAAPPPSSRAAAQQAAEYRLQGLEAMRQRQLTEAIALLRQSITLAPDNLNGRVMLGWTLHLDGQAAAAKAELMEVISRDPSNVKAFNAIGIANLVTGDLSYAVLFHLWGAWLQPDNEIAYYNLSLALQRLGLYAPALATGSRATQLEPENPHPWIAVALSQWDTQQIPQAQATYRQALALDGRYGDRAFLGYLNEAGFSSDQIQTTRQILTSLSR